MEFTEDQNFDEKFCVGVKVTFYVIFSDYFSTLKNRLFETDIGVCLNSCLYKQNKEFFCGTL